MNILSQSNNQKSSPYLALAFFIMAIDQLSKLIIINFYNLFEATHFTSFFSIIRLHNKGAAFSFLANEAGWQKWFFVFVAIFSICFFIFLLFKESSNAFKIAISILIGGSAGNLIDRLNHGFVIDFLHFYYEPYLFHFPVINLADIAISVSIIYLGIVILFQAAPNKSTAANTANQIV